MHIVPISWDISTIIAVIGCFLGIINTYILVKQHKYNKKQTDKADLQLQPNFDISLLYSDKIRNSYNINLNKDADIKDVPFDTVDLELKVVGGIATNLKLDVFPIIDISFYGMSESKFPLPLRVPCIASNFFCLGTFPSGENLYLKKSEGNLYFLHVLSSTINAKLKKLYPNDLVFAVATPQYYSCISYTDSYRKQQEYYLHNNLPISAESYKENTDACKCYVDFNSSNIDDGLIVSIINLAYPENQ